MSISDRLDEIEQRCEAASWSMAARHLLTGRDVPELVEAVRRRDAALRAVLDLHNPHPHEGMGWREDHTYGYLGTVCGTCGTPDEYGVPYPCPTVRAIEAALGEDQP